MDIVERLNSSEFFKFGYKNQEKHIKNQLRDTLFNYFLVYSR